MSDCQRVRTTFEFPHCIGCVDVKHVRIVKPNGSGSICSICDESYNFIFVCIGSHGKNYDASISQRVYSKINFQPVNLTYRNPVHWQWSARRHAECTFGSLINKLRIFYQPLNMSIDFA
ncbi:hypothetical protein PR048_026856 [Dryococelus australis]|uniref:DDE Tnp4 domain-containing protein n=1 Tax=Dryococelus australis TaxID=614101 RepID=A0ABQ9GMJ1_9NEOP|nr:hypothetical protein PR048_026856 [Dryococelus australis]